MDLKFKCSRCGQKILVDDSMIGITIECPNCELLMQVPASGIKEIKNKKQVASYKKINKNKVFLTVFVSLFFIILIYCGYLWYTNNIYAKKIYKNALSDFEKGNYEKAITGFNFALSKKIHQANYNLGYCYFYGLGIKQNISKAIFHLKNSSEYIKPNTQYIIGLCYVNDNKINNAMLHFKRAAAQNHIQSQFVLGLIYFREKNFTEAIYWFKQAANKGCTKSKFMLKECYKEGLGIIANPHKTITMNTQIANINLSTTSKEDKIIKSLLPFNHKANDNLDNSLAEVYNQTMQAIGVVVLVIQQNYKTIDVPIGTAFAISKNHFITNSHVAHGCRFENAIFSPTLEAVIRNKAEKAGYSFNNYLNRLEDYEIKQIKREVYDFLKNNNWKIKHIEIRLNHSKGKKFKVAKIKAHPKYNPKDNGEFDVAIMEIDKETDCYFEIASQEELYDLKVGTQIASAGFPMEGLNDLSLRAPEASYAIGTIKKMTNFKNEDEGAKYNRSIFHTIPAAGGASGSPIFTADGKVIAVLWGGANHNLGIGRVAHSAMQNYAVRIDQIETIGEVDTYCQDWIKAPY